VRIIELVGALSFSSLDYLCRSIIEDMGKIRYLILDMARVPEISIAAIKLLDNLTRNLRSDGITVLFSGANTDVLKAISEISGTDTISRAEFRILDEALEWAENQILAYNPEYAQNAEFITLGEQFLLSNFSGHEIADMEQLCVERVYRQGEKIFSFGEPALSIFFLQSGAVSIKLPNGVILSELSAGMSFGELALIEDKRSADVWADTDVKCLELMMDSYVSFCRKHVGGGEKFLLNAARLLTQRLRLANSKVNNLTTRR